MDNFKLSNSHSIATIATAQTALTPKLKHRIDVDLQNSSPKGTLLQKSGTTTEQFREKETRNGLVPFLNNYRNYHHEAQRKNNHTITSFYGDDIFPPLKITDPEIGGCL